MSHLPSVHLSAPSPFDDFPDHEFWKAHSVPISNPPSLLGPALAAQQSRKLSRKLPPELTESLVDLSRSSMSSPLPSPVCAPVSVANIDRPMLTLPPAHFVLSVEAPSAELGANHAIASSSLRKASSSCSTRRPSSADTASTMSLRTPNSSLNSLAPSFAPHSSPLSCSAGSASTCGSWSLLDDIKFAEAEDAARKPKESRKEKKARKVAEAAAFDVDTLPDVRALFEASLLEVIDEDGERVRFGDLVRHRRTIVVFIRHWFCPLCAQYMNSILAEVSLDALEEADVDLLIIGNGSDKMLNGYRNKAFRCPFKMYTDPTLSLYRALGLTRKTADAGRDEDKGDYLVQTPLESTIQTLKRATVMPLRNPGHFFQLGGEFVFDGALKVIYAHRMITTRSHAPIRDVCAEAGVRLEFIHYEPGPPPPPVHRSSMIAEEDEEDWREERDMHLERMLALKIARRQRVVSGKYGAERDDDEVRIVGEEWEEETDNLDNLDNLDNRFGALGITP